MAKLFLWTLGNLEHKVFPTADSIQKLQHVVGRVAEDLDQNQHAHMIWGPELEVRSFDVDDDATHVVIDVQDIAGSDQIKINLEEKVVEDHEDD